MQEGDKTAFQSLQPDCSIHKMLNESSGMLSATRDILSAARMKNSTSNKDEYRKGSYLTGQNEDISNNTASFSSPISAG